MPVRQMTEEQFKEERRREKEEREWYAEENKKTRTFQLELERVKAKTECERIREQKRYIHAIVLLKLFNKKIPKVFIKHLS